VIVAVVRKRRRPGDGLISGISTQPGRCLIRGNARRSASSDLPQPSIRTGRRDVTIDSRLAVGPRRQLSQQTASAKPAPRYPLRTGRGRSLPGSRITRRRRARHVTTSGTSDSPAPGSAADSFFFFGRRVARRRTWRIGRAPHGEWGQRKLLPIRVPPSWPVPRRVARRGSRRTARTKGETTASPMTHSGRPFGGVGDHQIDTQTGRGWHTEEDRANGEQERDADSATHTATTRTRPGVFQQARPRGRPEIRTALK